MPQEATILPFAGETTQERPIAQELRKSKKGGKVKEILADILAEE